MHSASCKACSRVGAHSIKLNTGNWTKSRGGHSFEGGRSFTKLGYNIKCFRYILPTLMFIDAIPKKKRRIRCSEIASEVMFGPKVTASEPT